ncbi:MAG: hypothetical protein UX13_C0016G0002 [Candidatus Woesebacteria bacterium GW2011_GWB1_45_5]|uniref:Uncharacterized protein n=1 Tax=Candidatus Woesebacteria bacterium GW2011_GWB1_45_5 TaxID=1618581 RepID=A0A0G1QNN4_9BACT|nr:MAG: hypothetical protein UX13_C0016G0002 [Candidatus Woesebacteria bacterium GW2011_GWB1_45_5]
MKKRLLIALGALVLIAIVYVLIKARQTEETPSITPRRPGIPSYITGKLPIEFLIEKEGFDFPSQLPTISVSRRALDKSSVSAIAERLGLGSTLSEFEDANEGTKYYASNDKYSYIATPKTSTVKFGMTVSEVPVAVEKNITDEEFVNIATEFLTENAFYAKDKIKALPVVYLKPSSVSEGLEKTDRNSAQVFQIGFTFSSSEYEILTAYSDAPRVTVQLLTDGDVYSSEILLIDGIQKGLTEYPLKTHEEVSAGLDEARLIGLSGDYISPSDLTISDITSLKVEKIRLVYFLEQGKEQFLQPIYLLEGPAGIRNSSANFATIYLPAYK